MRLLAARKAVTEGLGVCQLVGVDLANNISLYRTISACVTLLLGYSAMRYGPDSDVSVYPRSCFDITLDNRMHADQY